MKSDYTIHKNQSHVGWNMAITPVKTIRPGTVVTFETLDSSGGQIGPHSNVSDVASLDFSKVNPVTGPVYVEGAEPGDALKITILGFAPSGWGWTAIIPGFGLLADRFDKPALHIWDYDPITLERAEYKPGGKVPLKPFPGTIGLAPDEEGELSVVNPRRVGGNMDTRDIGVGTVLFLPVEVPGALLSVGDTHAAQGDGEVCGTAIESPMDVSLRIELEKNVDLQFPRFNTPGPVTREIDFKGYEVAMGIGPDLMASAVNAVSNMVDFISDNYRMSPEEAYMLCSVCGSLRISEIVDAPNWIVSYYFPKAVFD
jgi:acetamidase/formamidase